MPEEEAFCVLVKVMFDYGLRELYKPGFEELHVKFYQLERLMQVIYYQDSIVFELIIHSFTQLPTLQLLLRFCLVLIICSFFQSIPSIIV